MLKKLVDGRLVDSSSEEWRQECEARHAVNMPRLADRQAFLADLAKKRGQAAATQMHERMHAIRVRDEAQRVAEMPRLRDRREHLERVELDRGAEARKELEAVLAAIWQDRKAAA